MYKVAVIGDIDSVLSFKAAGFEVYETSNASRTKDLLKKFASSEYAAVFITEQAASEVLDVIDEFKDKRLPSIVLIPNNRGSMGLGRKQMEKDVERAVGANILAN